MKTKEKPKADAPTKQEERFAKDVARVLELFARQGKAVRLRKSRPAKRSPK